VLNPIVWTANSWPATTFDIFGRVSISATMTFLFLVHFTSICCWLFQFYVKFTICRRHEHRQLYLERQIQTLIKTGVLSRVILYVVLRICCFASFGKEVRRTNPSQITGSRRKRRSLLCYISHMVRVFNPFYSMLKWRIHHSYKNDQQDATV